MAELPSSAAAVGLRRTICTVPLMSRKRSSTSVVVLRPAPTKVMAWPALALAWPASAGVPLKATPVMLARLTV